MSTILGHFINNADVADDHRPAPVYNPATGAQTKQVAMASKTTVVGSEAGGIPEIIRPNETGRIVPTENAEALASAIEATLWETETTDQFRENGRRFVEREHSLDHMLDRLETIYRAAIHPTG